MSTILMVEDDAAIRQVTAMHIRLAGYEVYEAASLQEARKMLSQHLPDLVLLDIMLPDDDEGGFSLGENLISQQIKVIFLTARTAVPDRVHGLRMGAEDYVLKPFEPAELIARIENVLRRGEKQETIWEKNGLRIDFEARLVWRDHNEITLTSKEYDLLIYLVRHENVAISRETLLNTVWGYDYIGETRTVDNHIKRLRDKIGSEWIETVYKCGYRFRESDETNRSQIERT